MSVSSSDDARADIQAIKQAIGKINAEVYLIQKVKLETKNEKYENKYLVITTYRIFVITKQKQVKVDTNLHFIDINNLEPQQLLCLRIGATVNERNILHKFLFESQDEVDTVCAYIKAMCQKNIPGVGLQAQIKIETEERRQIIEAKFRSIMDSLSAGDQLPCGSFVTCYNFTCNYYNLAPLPEIIWDIDRVYSSHCCKEFDVEDFDHLDQKDLIPLVHTLAYNTWFNSLTMTSIKLSSELADVVLQVVKLSKSIEEYTFTDLHLNKEQIQKLAQAISLNPYKVLRKLNLSGNDVEDKGITSLTNLLGNVQHGFATLRLSDVRMSNKGASLLANTFKNNPYMNMTLKTLNLSHNQIKHDGAQVLCDFLAQANVLEELDLSHTEAALDLIFGALLRGCQQHLQCLNLSNNPFSYKKSKDRTLQPFQQFFSLSQSLSKCDISTSKFPSDALKAIFIGLMQNPSLTNLELNLSHNELKSAGASEIISCVSKIRCLTSLNLAFNNLEQDLSQLCEALGNSSSIKHLNVSHNLSKPKYNSSVAESLAEMVMSETLPLESLNIGDLKLRHDAGPILDCLGTNETLVSVDVSGNGIGDIGARLLAKALQLNTKIKAINIDRNNITYKGLKDIAYAMKRNFSLSSIELPIADLTTALKSSSEAFTQQYKLIEQALSRNGSLNKSTTEHSYNVHQASLLNSVNLHTNTIDRFVVQLQDLVMERKGASNELIMAEVKVAKTLIKEADAFREIALELFRGTDRTLKHVKEKFAMSSKDVSDSMNTAIRENACNLVETTRKRCPISLKNEGRIKEIKENIEIPDVNNGFIDSNKAEYMYSESSLTVAVDIIEKLKSVLVDSIKTTIKRLNQLSKEDNPVPTIITPTQPLASERKQAKHHHDETDDPDEQLNALLVDENEKSVPSLRLDISSHEDDGVKSPIADTSIMLPFTFTPSSPDDDDTDVVAIKARNRLSTLGVKLDRENWKSSLKRRPTVLRHVVPEEAETFKLCKVSIDIGDVVDDSKKEESEGVKRTDTLSAFDAVSDTATSLSVKKDRARPMQGRRAPTRVSNLRHMEEQDTDALEELKSPTKMSAPPTPQHKQPRPVSLAPAMLKTGGGEVPPPKPARRVTAEKSLESPSRTKSDCERKKAPTPEPEKKKSGSDKKSKKQPGGIQLPGLPGFLKRRDTHNKNSPDVHDAKPETPTEGKAKTPVNTRTNSAGTPTHPQRPAKPALPEVATAATSATTAENTEDANAAVPESKESKESPEKPPPPQQSDTPTTTTDARPAKPEPFKRDHAHMMGVPAMGGADLLAEMKMKQKTKEPMAPPRPRLPTTESAPSRPTPPKQRVGSISKQPPPPRPNLPKRPPSIKSPSSEPAKVLPPSKEEDNTESVPEETVEETKEEESADSAL